MAATLGEQILIPNFRSLDACLASTLAPIRYTPLMLMVIFGAGASYDSAPDFPAPSGLEVIPSEPWRPPLTNDLFLDRNDQFGDIVQRYPRHRSILPFLRRPQSGSVEQQLELYLNQASTDQERQRQLFSVRYYLHDLFRMVSDQWLKRTGGVTNYATLIDQIRHLNTSGDSLCLVSFNYDLLLDHAIFPSGANTEPLERHFAHTMFKLFKPHGSVDWATLATGPEASRFPPFANSSRSPRRGPDQLIELAPELKLSGQYVRANATDAHQMFSFDQSIVPAIAIPVQTKTDDTFEWPDSHRKYLEELLPRISQILIIGWRGKEEHFLNLLREKLPRGGITQITHLQIVGSVSAEVEEISKEFITRINRGVRKVPALHAQGFSDFVRQEQVRFLFKD